MNTHVRFPQALAATLALAVALGGASAAFAANGKGNGKGNDTYQVTNLVSDGFAPAAHNDPNLVNPWGVAFNPFGFVWVADNGTGLSTLYDGDGNPQSLVVQIPSASGEGTGTPTGIVFNGSSDASSFAVTSPTSGASGTSKFLFATEDGIIAGWAPSVDLTHAFVGVDNSVNEANYKGLAIGAGGSGQMLYAADFHNGRVDVFDSTFAPVALGSGAFTDPNLPEGYAPFGIQAIGGNIYVAYAKHADDSDEEDEEEAGPGLGFVDAYDPNGVLLDRVATHGTLNAPWGMALAPAGFGRFSNALLVGNFGDGTISAFDLKNNTPLGQLRGADHKPISIEGLWGIAFGNGLQNQPVNTLFFAAGVDDEAHGLYGRIDAAQ
jgi:uncharacterized protein (TIGR03118 family)